MQYTYDSFGCMNMSSDGEVLLALWLQDDCVKIYAFASLARIGVRSSLGTYLAFGGVEGGGIGGKKNTRNVSGNVSVWGIGCRL